MPSLTSILGINIPSILDDPDVQPLLRRKAMSTHNEAPPPVSPDADDNPPCGPVYPPTSIEPGGDELPDDVPFVDEDFDGVEDDTFVDDEDDEDADRDLDDTFTLEDE